MANLTITIDESLLKRARIRALEQGTSVNALVRTYLEAWAGEVDAGQRTAAEIIESSKRSKSRRGKRTWTRDQLHER